jgi:hypothetical protein
MNTELKEKMQQAAIEMATLTNGMVDIDRKIGFEAGVDAMYSALKDQIEWVSVEDRLPEHADNVLFKCRNGVLYAGFYDYATFRDGNRNLIYNVKYWRRIEL